MFQCYEITPKLVKEIEAGWNATYLCDKLRVCDVNSKYQTNIVIYIYRISKAHGFI